MNDAELYHNSNALQKRDAQHCLEEYAAKIKWRNFDTILDIGCGDGGVTTSILKSYIPNRFKRLVGCDISEQMVKFANQHHGDDRTTFSVMDIVGDLPEHCKSSFDHVFSFYALHWIHDQEKVFSNIYRLLHAGGDCLLIFLGQMPVFDVFRALAKNPKWNKWLRDVHRFVSPYHDSQDPEKEVRRLMAKIGFKNITVECKEMSFAFDGIEECKKAVKAVNPFKIPSHLQDDFFDDYMQVVKKMRKVIQINNNEDDHVNVNTNYTLLVAYATK